MLVLFKAGAKHILKCNKPTNYNVFPKQKKRKEKLLTVLLKTDV